MPSKKIGEAELAAAKRGARQPRMSNKTSRFQKDWERHSKAGHFNMGDLRTVMLSLIANDGPLPPERRDHALADSRRWKGCRECHVHGDYLLVYQLIDGGETVVFTAIGTHAELSL